MAESKRTSRNQLDEIFSDLFTSGMTCSIFLAFELPRDDFVEKVKCKPTIGIVPDLFFNFRFEVLGAYPILVVFLVEVSTEFSTSVTHAALAFRSFTFLRSATHTSPINRSSNSFAF